MKIARAQDLTVGAPVKVLSIYAIPMLISMFFQQAYNLVDSWIAGNYIGDVALGAVGTCYPVTVFLIAISSGLSLGTSIYCSQSYGAKAYGKVKSAITTSLLIYMPLAVMVSAVGLMLSTRVMGWLSVPAEVRGATLAYLRIYLIGFLFQFLYNIVNGVLTGLGNSKTPLYYLILSSVCNIVLDWLFVVTLGAGVAGLALATVLSQALSALLTLWTVVTMSRRLEGAGEIFSRDIMVTVVKLGVPSMIQHLFMSLGQLSVQSVINGYGLVVMAGYSVAFRINGLVMNSLMALSNALSGYIAQNKGAGEHGRIRAGLRASLVIAYVFSASVMLVLQIWGPEILGIFVEEAENTAAVIAAGMSFVRVVSPFYLLVCGKIVFDGALRGRGAMTLFLITAIADVCVRMICDDWFSQLWGLYGVWAVWPTAWLVGTSMSMGFYLWHSRKDREN